PAELGDAVLATQAFQHDADLLLGREVPPRGAPDVPDSLLRALRSLLVSLSHRVPPRGDDEPETLPYAISSKCPVGPDGGQNAISLRISRSLSTSAGWCRPSIAPTTSNGYTSAAI